MASSISDDVDLSISISEQTITSFEPESGSESRKPKPRTQLDRWSRARAIKTGRKLERSLSQTSNSEHNSPRNGNVNGNGNSLSPLTPPGGVSENESDDVEVTAVKSIYMISDGTGWTAEHAVNAALGQFNHCLADRACAVNTHLFPAVDNVEKIIRIVKQAAKEGAILLYTIAEPSQAEYARKACKMWGVPYTDILSPITEAIGSHLGVSPSGLPRGAPGRDVPLTEDYFKRIEAVEFTIKQDDGALPRNLDMADIILTGVSRTGKTPLSIYLSQKGYKVANVPIVMGLEPPPMLFKVDQDKVFGLTINPVALQTIRRVRAKTLGLAKDEKNNYSDMGYVREDLVYARQIFARNPGWPVIDVTTKAIEETAAVVLKIYLDRKQKCSVPRISKRY